MPSRAYNQIAEAMRRMYQVGGRTSEGPLIEPTWKCFFVSKIRALELCDGEWRAGERHRTKQTCVEEVDLDVNPSSPYDPKRKV